MLNFIAATTRQWNCGDEFILFGIKKLMEEIFNKEFINWIIFDRNPDLNKIRQTDKLVSNSWHCDTLSNINYIIVAGSPAWFGDTLQSLYSVALKENRHIFFIGIGTQFEEVEFTELDRDIIYNSPLIIGRDFNVQKVLNKIEKPCNIFPCPAFYAFKGEKLRKKIGKIGLVVQHHKTSSNNIDEATFYKILELGKFLGCDIICHYVDEYLESINHFSKVKYSYDAHDYFDIYNNYDLIISTRLHGAIFAMSNGIPTILIKREGFELENKRICGAAELFPDLIVCKTDEVINNLTFNYELISSNLINYKHQSKLKYIDELSRFFKLQ